MIYVKYISIIAMSKQLKVVIIGANRAGKTALIVRLINNVFKEAYLRTGGVNVVSYQDGNRIYNLWDLEGNSKFLDYSEEHFYKDTDVIICVYDMSCDLESQYTDLENKVSKASSVTQRYISLITVGTKSDCFNGEAPPELLLCSNKSGSGIQELRDRLRII